MPIIERMPYESRKKLGQFAKEQGLTYQTMYKHWKAGHLSGVQLESGTILVDGWKEGVNNEKFSPSNRHKKRVIIYSRVFNGGEAARQLLETVTEGLKKYALDHDWEIVDVVTEISTPFSEKRTPVARILARDDWDVLLVETKDAFMKFNEPYIEILLNKLGKEVVAKHDLMFVSKGDSTDGTADGELIILIKKIQSLLKTLIGVTRQKHSIEKSIQALLH